MYFPFSKEQAQGLLSPLQKDRKNLKFISLPFLSFP